VITATSSLAEIVTPSHLKPGAVVVDVARPLNVARSVEEERPDVLVLEGGLVKVPTEDGLGWDFGLPPGVAYACMCEPMLLALDSRYDDAHVGVDVPRELVAKLRAAAARHGLRLAPPRSFGHPVTSEHWERVRRARARSARPRLGALTHRGA
jgi:fatty aldehyde-generating acyl-ACP reductase